MKVLHLDSSIQGDASASRRLTQETVDALRAGNSSVSVTYRDLTADITGHFSGRDPNAVKLPGEKALNDELIEEFLAADVLVIGAPMYNFSIPTHLKSWFDRVLVAGKTFQYGPNGAEGLAVGKKAIVILTAGGVHAGGPSGAAHEEYLRRLLNFVGIKDIEFVRAEGLAMGLQEASLAGARAQIHELLAA
jgi:FMN-dependent NADH-azoreductase